MAYNIDSQVLAEVMSGTASDSYQLRQMLVERLPLNDFEPGFRLALGTKDLSVALGLAGAAGLRERMAMTQAALRWYATAERAGLGNLDKSALLLLGDGRMSFAENL